MEKIEHMGNNVILTFHTGNVYTLPYAAERRILESWQPGTDFENHLIRCLKAGGEK